MNNKVLKRVIKRLEKSVFDLDQLRQKSIVFQNKMIYIVYQLFNSFSLSQKPLLRFDKEEPDQLKLPDCAKVSRKRFYEIKNNIDNNKVWMTRVKDASSKKKTHQI